MNMDLFQKNNGSRGCDCDIASVRKALMMMKGLHRESSSGGAGGASGGGGEGAGIRRMPFPPGYFGASRPPSRLERSLLRGFKYVKVNTLKLANFSSSSFHANQLRITMVKLV